MKNEELEMKNQKVKSQSASATKNLELKTKNNGFR
jgi:hypothetical protein